MNQNKSFENLQIKEMQIRNYSPRTIDTYCKLLCKLEKAVQTNTSLMSLENIFQ